MKQRSVECDTCGAVKSIRAMYAIDVYDTPWEEKAHTIYVCKHTPREFKAHYRYNWMESCEELLDDSSWADFRYFTCCICNRMICEQNPANGWHVQYRFLDDDSGEQVCLQCYEKMMFDDGLSDDDLESGKLRGMFFNDSELIEHGFYKVEDYFIRGQDQANKVIEQAKTLKAAGCKVVINYESLAIGGLEGYVSLWATAQLVTAD